MDICVSLYVNSMRSVIVLIKLLCMYVAYVILACTACYATALARFDRSNNQQLDLPGSCRARGQPARSRLVPGT